MQHKEQYLHKVSVFLYIIERYHNKLQIGYNYIMDHIAQFLNKIKEVYCHPKLSSIHLNNFIHQKINLINKIYGNS